MKAKKVGFGIAIGCVLLISLWVGLERYLTSTDCFEIAVEAVRSKLDLQDEFVSATLGHGETNYRPGRITASEEVIPGHAQLSICLELADSTIHTSVFLRQNMRLEWEVDTFVMVEK